MKKYKPTTKKELESLVKNRSIKLSDIDTSLITDMSELFQESKRKDFSGIETWDVSNVTNMNAMFRDARRFNQDISSWNVSNVENMAGMFRGAKSFDQNKKPKGT